MFFVVIILSLGILITVFLSQKTQTVNQHAASAAGDITVDFSNRQNTSHPISKHFAGMNGFSKIQGNTQIYSYLSPSHFDLMRVSVDMVGTFPSSTQQNWSQLDSLIGAIQSQNLQPMFTIGYTPNWLQPNPNPCGTGSSHVMPTNASAWGQLAAAVVAHMDQKFPGIHPLYELWNEPDGTTFMCVVSTDPNPDQTRLNEYKQIYAAAAPLMKQQAQKDGMTIQIGGPALAVPKARASLWFPALVSDPTIAPYLDFITFHDYQNGGAVGDTWTTFLTGTQSPTTGQAAIFEQISSYVRKGIQPNAAKTPIYDDEYNTNTGLPNSARNDPTYGPLWNSLIIADLLNTVNDTASPYGAAQQPIAGLTYFVATQPPPGNEFCLFGTWNSAMDCTAGNTPYPQYYAYQLFTDSKYLDITNNGFVATAANTTKLGLVVTGFYTATKNNVVIVNTSGASYANLTITLQNPGNTNATTATVFTLNQANPHIATAQSPVQSGATGYTSLVNVPAYSTVALSVNASGSSGGTISPTVTVTPPLTITGNPTLPPSPTINPNDTLFSFAVCPHGEGKCGDNVSPNGGGNTKPLHLQRAVTVSVYDSSNTLILSKPGNILYNPVNQNFSGTVDMGTLASGSYQISVKMDGYLGKKFTGIQTITARTTNTLTSVPSLVTGDITNDNQIDIQDYNILAGCYGSKLSTSSCPSQYQPSPSSPGADLLDDDGQVDGSDYNEFLRELSVQTGQ